MEEWSVGAVSAPKRGCEDASCEDAHRVGDHSVDCDRFRVAVSDGATESAFAKLWANSLVAEFVSNAGWERDLNGLARRWATDVWSRDLAWNVQERASEGAHASLLGAVISVTKTARWQTKRWHVHATIFGDSCMFVLDPDGEITKAEPYQKAEEFDAHPYLLSTSPVHRKRALEHRKTRRASMTNDQWLLLSTDAIGRWMLKAPPDQRIELAEITFASDRPAFDVWLETHREDRSLKDDDCTVVTISRG